MVLDFLGFDNLERQRQRGLPGKLDRSIQRERVRGSMKTEESENRDALHLSQRETNEGQRED